MEMKAHGLQNRTVAIIENGSWGVLSGKQIQELLGSMKNMTILENMITIKSSLKEGQLEELETLADQIVASMA